MGFQVANCKSEVHEQSMKEEEDMLSECSTESSVILKHASLLGGELTSKERLSIFCKPSFKLRTLKNKGAIMVLIWSYFCVSLASFYLQVHRDSHKIEVFVQAVILGLTLAIAGWIADVYFGRYRVIYFSMWIMWASLMLATANSVLASTINSYPSDVYSYVNGAFWAIVSIGFGGFQANVIQFGIDQLYDASSGEISSFIVWYVWTCNISGCVVSLILDCISKQFWIVGNLVMCIYLTLSLSSMLMFKHWLVKEPVTQNPFKLVYSVVRYAIKHKHPECRSAFTYCEDEPPSRIDFGKRKYGGPFTTEQVEDVKTFLKFTTAMFVGIMSFGVIFAVNQYVHKVLNMLTNARDELLLKFISKDIFANSYAGVVIILPLYELLIYPLFHKCLGVMNTQWTFILGVVSITSTTLSLLVIEIAVRYSYLANNITIACMGSDILSTSVDFHWIIVPLFLRSLSAGAFSIGGLKLIASQTPYSMRGLTMGTCYCIYALCLAVGVGISIPFTRELSIWGTGIISCGFWYALLLLVIEVLVGSMLIAMLRWYKKRKREDVLPNEHIFAERYYDRDS